MRAQHSIERPAETLVAHGPMRDDFAGCSVLPHRGKVRGDSDFETAARSGREDR